MSQEQSGKRNDFRLTYHVSQLTVGFALQVPGGEGGGEGAGLGEGGGGLGDGGGGLGDGGGGGGGFGGGEG